MKIWKMTTDLLVVLIWRQSAKIHPNAQGLRKKMELLFWFWDLNRQDQRRNGFTGRYCLIPIRRNSVCHLVRFYVLLPIKSIGLLVNINPSVHVINWKNSIHSRGCRVCLVYLWTVIAPSDGVVNLQESSTADKLRSCLICRRPGAHDSFANENNMRRFCRTNWQRVTVGGLEPGSSGPKCHRGNQLFTLYQKNTQYFTHATTYRLFLAVHHLQSN